MDFRPHLHPRNRLGRFVEKPGARVLVPGKGSGFFVAEKNGVAKITPSADFTGPVDERGYAAVPVEQLREPRVDLAKRFGEAIQSALDSDVRAPGWVRGEDSYEEWRDETLADALDDTVRQLKTEGAVPQSVEGLDDLGAELTGGGVLLPDGREVVHDRRHGYRIYTPTPAQAIEHDREARANELPPPPQSPGDENLGLSRVQGLKYDTGEYAQLENLVDLVWYDGFASFDEYAKTYRAAAGWELTDAQRVWLNRALDQKRRAVNKRQRSLNRSARGHVYPSD